VRIVYAPDFGVPTGVECQECGRVARPGQSILHREIRNWGHLVWHKGCLTKILESMPDDLDGPVEVEYARLQDKFVEAGKLVF